MTILIIFLLIISLIIPKKYWNPLVKILCTIMMYSALIIPKVKGFDINKIPYPVIFIANHVSFFDLFIAGSILPGYPRGFELSKHFYTPIYGWFISRFGQIPTELNNPLSLKKSILQAFKILKNKERNLYIAPEGTRTKNGKIGHFNSGGFYLSKKMNIPVIPVLFKNLFNRNNKNSILINYGFFDTIIFDPVYPEKFQKEDEMAKYVMDLMIKNIGLINKI